MLEEGMTMSVRKVKQYDERYNEILDTAQEQFADIGYEKVSVQNIIDRIGIAKGTFYHYFKSKDELMSSLTQRFTTLLLKQLEPILTNDSLTAAEKLNQLMVQGTVSKFSGMNKKVIKIFMKLSSNPKNSGLMQKIQDRVIVQVIPIYSAIIEEGAKEGIFDVDYYDEAADMIIHIGKSFQPKWMEILTLDDPEEVRTKFERMMRIFEQSIERLLGAKPGVITFVTPEVVDSITSFSESK